MSMNNKCSRIDDERVKVFRKFLVRHSDIAINIRSHDREAESHGCLINHDVETEGNKVGGCVSWFT